MKGAPEISIDSSAFRVSKFSRDCLRKRVFIIKWRRLGNTLIAFQIVSCNQRGSFCHVYQLRWINMNAWTTIGDEGCILYRLNDFEGGECREEFSTDPFHMVKCSIARPLGVRVAKYRRAIQGDFAQTVHGGPVRFGQELKIGYHLLDGCSLLWWDFYAGQN
jgi:hypothetical protein